MGGVDVHVIEADVLYGCNIAEGWMGEGTVIPSGTIAWNIDNEQGFLL